MKIWSILMALLACMNWGFYHYGNHLTVSLVAGVAAIWVSGFCLGKFVGRGGWR